MLSAFLTGFFIGISLIMAIGPQNAFVLRQGILSQHVFYVALFCAFSDTFLIVLGVAGISFLLNDFISQNSNLIFGFSALWLTCYGLIRLKSMFKSDKILEVKSANSKDLVSTLSVLAILTFANPHVYLDTMILIGSVSQQFDDHNKISFAVGASLASFIFFFSISYGAKLLGTIMQSPLSWRILDLLIAVIMFSIAIKLAYIGNWL